MPDDEFNEALFIDEFFENWVPYYIYMNPLEISMQIFRRDFGLDSLQ